MPKKTKQQKNSILMKKKSTDITLFYVRKYLCELKTSFG